MRALPAISIYVYVGVRVDVACSRKKRLRNLNLKSQFSVFDSLKGIRVYINDFLKFVGVLWAFKWACETFFGLTDSL